MLLEKLKDYKIIDWMKEGNVVRFFFGKKELDGWYGDDWDDRPYEHNAETVYSEFVEGYIDMAWPLDTVVKEPCEGYYNSPYCKDDFKLRNIPIIVTHKLVQDEYRWAYSDFQDCFTAATEKIFMGDPVDTLEDKGTILEVNIKDHE